jgi:hypothetical protein
LLTQKIFTIESRISVSAYPELTTSRKTEKINVINFMSNSSCKKKPGPPETGNPAVTEHSPGNPAACQKARGFPSLLCNRFGFVLECNCFYGFIIADLLSHVHSDGIFRRFSVNLNTEPVDRTQKELLFLST